MKDQAEQLRQVIENLKLRHSANQAALSNSTVKHARVITITSGKGGVGKTNISINLAVSLSELGYKVVILDADFGLANIDVLFGITTRYNLGDLIYGRKNIYEVLTDGPGNIRFISGGSGVEELVRIDKPQLDKFVKSISFLDKIADFILIDTGAGLADAVMSFVMAADEVLLVTTPEPTSITDAYALVKMVANRDSRKNIKVVVNRAETAKEANDILNKLCVVAEKFLSVKLQPAGYILQDELVWKAVKMQQPFSLLFPKSQAAKLIKEVSRVIAEGAGRSAASENNGVKNFVRRLVELIHA